MTNEEKLRETFPNTIFIFRKNGNNETVAIMVSDEWLQGDYDQMYKDAEPCCESMDFPDTFEEFVESYGIKDSKEVYTNGSVLIPVFRVKQWLDHISLCEDRMKYVQETVNTMLNTCTTNSVKDKVFRNAARFVQNAIDGKEPNFEKIDEPEPCEDCVSREAVLDALVTCFDTDSVYDENNGINYIDYDDAVNEVLDLPPVTPKPKTGKWIHQGHEGEWRAAVGECSACGREHIFGLPYCPCCGVKMEGVSE